MKLHQWIQAFQKTMDQKFINNTRSEFLKNRAIEIPELPLVEIRIAFEDLLCGITKEKYLKSETGCRKDSAENMGKKASHMSISTSYSTAMASHELIPRDAFQWLVAACCLFDYVFIRFCAYKLRKIKMLSQSCYSGEIASKSHLVCFEFRKKYDS